MPLRADVASVVRRIERFLYRGLVKQHEAAQSIIDALPENGRFILTMDGTSWQLGKFKYYGPSGRNLLQREYRPHMLGTFPPGPL